MHSAEYSPAARRFLLDEARRSIAHGLEHGAPAAPADNLADEALSHPRACFVTLSIANELRGCTGSLLPEHPLAHSVVLNAYQSAFGDPRFPCLRQRELTETAIEISVLSPLAPMAFTGERDLLRQLNVGVDGLVLELGAHRATFLPKVWEMLPEPAEFLAHLKHKAGLRPDFWSERLTVYRYHTETFSETTLAQAS